MKDIMSLECVQQRATRLILNNYYQHHLVKLGMLLLMYVYDELADIMLFVKSLRFPNSSFNILDFVTFSTNPTRSFGSKLYHKFSSINLISNSYFYRLPRLWNSLPVIDTSLPIPYNQESIKDLFLESFC